MNQDVKKIKIEEYNYTLPEDRIARFPLDKRDDSKLLISSKNGFDISTYGSLSRHLPENSFLLFNETKVIQARLLFPKNEKTLIEIFCLEPAGQMDIQFAMAKKQEIEYVCLVGGARKWKSGILTLNTSSGNCLTAEKLENRGGSFLIKFRWSENLTFSEILEELGKTPLPPYLNRKAVESDQERYQTVFAKISGSVAAPTASLHFTPEVLNEIERKGIRSAKLTLHVGAGTFKPVDTDKIRDHDMHAEEFLINLPLLEKLKLEASKTVIPVGTTSMRALESIYWLGFMASNNELKASETPLVKQWIAYESNSALTTTESLDALIDYMRTEKMDTLLARTAIIIAPSYEFRFCKGLITNFHQPKSTLLLLVSALLGKKWKTMYDFALDNNFRFLSYGDGCLILDNL